MKPVDITKALKGDTGIKPLNLKAFGRDRLGQKTTTPPKADTEKYVSPYVTSGTLQQAKVAAYEDAPNYKAADYKSVSCQNCKAYERTDSLMGACDKYDFFARNDYTCDGWKKKK